VPYTTKDALVKNHLGSFQNLIDVEAKIVILIVYGKMPNSIFEILYDLGVRREDMIFMGIEWLNVSLPMDPPEEEAKKR
jgi:hypothetical protein